MSDTLLTGIITIALGIISLAALATVLSQKAQTAGVTTAAGNALATDILAAVSPVTGSAPQLNTFGNGL